MRIVEPRIYARAGVPLAVPLSLPSGPNRDDVGEIAWDGERSADWTIWRVGVVPGKGSADAVLAGWMDGISSGGLLAGGPGHEWGAAEDADADARLPIGGWVLVAPLAEGKHPTTLKVGPNAAAVVWDKTPLELGRGVLETVAAAQWAEADARLLGALLKGTLASPLARWRAELVLGAAGGAGRSGLRPGEVRTENEAASVLDVLARQVAWRWEAAISRLAGADRGVAMSVAERLLMGVRFESARGASVAPAWPMESSELDRLLDGLLDPSAEHADLVTAAKAWLDVQSRGAAWVVDDSGQTDAVSGEAMATLALANLTPSRAVCWARREDAGASGRLAEDLDAAPAKTVVLTTALCGELRADANKGAMGTVLVARVGSLQQRLGVLAAGMPVRPPGLSIGPLSADWTSGSLFTARVGGGPPVPTTAAAPTAARLLRLRGAGGEDSWSLFVECSAAPDEPVVEAGAAVAGYVRLWFGPFERPSAVWRIDGTGEVRDETPGGANPQARTGVARQVPVVKEGKRWRVSMPLPRSVIDERGLVRLGIERVDSAGRRSAWPRAMLPWQTEPGRAALDTSAW